MAHLPYTYLFHHVLSFVFSRLKVFAGDRPLSSCFPCSLRLHASNDQILFLSKDTSTSSHDRNTTVRSWKLTHYG